MSVPLNTNSIHFKILKSKTFVTFIQPSVDYDFSKFNIDMTFDIVSQISLYIHPRNKDGALPFGEASS